jgi:hypothetical protein
MNVPKDDSAVLTVSYGTLLKELARRNSNGWCPRLDEQEYVSDLVFNLRANQQSIERAVSGQAQRRDKS